MKWNWRFALLFLPVKEERGRQMERQAGCLRMENRRSCFNAGEWGRKEREREREEDRERERERREKRKEQRREK